jgi:ATP-dependent Lhr-like helicase
MQERLTEKNVFNLLHEKIREELLNLGFSKLTAPQIKAIPVILKGRNVLLIAPTGSGKTEAALLPIFSKLLRESTRKGISLIYITPLRALNRDMIKRLSYWTSKLNISAEVRHGDTEIKTRRKQALHPPDLLVTTPETLQAILPGTRMKCHLSHVQYVIIDEVHELAGDKRGAQLTIALERLRRITNGEFQRIGLSATVGNPKEIAKFIAGTRRPIEIIEVSIPKNYRFIVEYPEPEEQDFELAQELNTAPEAAARIRRILELVNKHKSALIFVNSRTNAEMLGRKFDQLSSEIAVHHGSLSKEERTSIEDEFKRGKLKAIICTSTLELGIDIGHIALVVQYLSPRQVSILIQRVGRSGHKIDLTSQGVTITAFPDDTLEAIAAAQKAYKNQLEPIKLHENALDVLAHQIIGILIDEKQIKIEELLAILHEAYPFRNLRKAKLLEVINYLHILGELNLEGETLRKTRKSWKYYYENLSMIPDEKRYPIINILTDRTIGALGDEFMALRARVGLNFICRGKVWRIVQIEEETGTVYVVPSEDPQAAIPGWDGEILPVPYELAQEVGNLRRNIGELLEKEKETEKALEKIAEKLSVNATVLKTVVEEINEHLKTNAPLPHDKLILLEAYEKYLIIHACLGENVNRTLGCIFDAILSHHDFIVGWWNDGYRILIEVPRKIGFKHMERLKNMLFNLSEAKVDKMFDEYLKTRFPFGYKMKFVAERFGALMRGKAMSMKKMGELAERFQKTPIYEETLREVLQEKIDLATVKKLMKAVSQGEIQVKTWLSQEKPTPIACHILEKYGETMELMAPERVILNNIEKMKKAILARKTTLLCLQCNHIMLDKRIATLPEELRCENCKSGLLTSIRTGQNPYRIKELFLRRKKSEALTKEEVEELTNARRIADLILSHGKKALIALNVKGIGPETAFRILGKMHQKEEEFYLDLLKAKIQYLRTRPYWENKRNQHY